MSDFLTTRLPKPERKTVKFSNSKKLSSWAQNPQHTQQSLYLNLSVRPDIWVLLFASPGVGEQVYFVFFFHKIDPEVVFKYRWPG